MVHYLLFVQNSYEQHFFSREVRGVSEFYKVGITQNKNLTSVFSQTVLKRTSNKRQWRSQPKNLGPKTVRGQYV